MVVRILPAVSDGDAARAVETLLSQLPDVEPGTPVGNSTQLLDTLAQLAGESLNDLPEVVLVHELIGPSPALELVREVGLRFPAVAVILMTSDSSPALFSAAMDSGARGLVGLPLSYDEVTTRVQAAAEWATGVRRHLGGNELPSGPAGSVVTVAGAKGGVGTTLIAVQLALAAQAAGNSVALVDMDLQCGDVASYLDVQYRRSIIDLAGIRDISPRVLQDAMFTHDTGMGLLLAPAEGEKGEELDDTAARQIIGALRARYQTVVIDCGAQLSSAGATAIEMADTSLLVVTPDVIAVRAAKRASRMWDRLQVRKPAEVVAVVNRMVRSTEIQPPLIERIVGTRLAATAVPAGFKELQPAVDAGRIQDLDGRSTVRQAIWGLAAELGFVRPGVEQRPGKRGRLKSDRGAVGVRRRGEG